MRARYLPWGVVLCGAAVLGAGGLQWQEIAVRWPVGIEYSDFPYRQFRKISSYVEAVPDSVPLRVQDLLLEVGYENHPLSRAGARFSIVSGPEAPEPYDRVFPNGFPWGSHACLIESDAYCLDRSP